MERDPRGFDLSLWSARELCGLCYASPRRSRRCIKIILLEGKPGGAHPLRGMVASLSVLAVLEYAKMLRYSQIEVQEPVPGAGPVYQSLGFTHDAEGRLVLPVSATPLRNTLQISEVFMSYSEESTKANLIERLMARAVRLSGKTTDQQLHILNVGLTQGKQLEPEGALAGPRAATPSALVPAINL
ncbi:hypothetical protein KSS94_25925 [Pseudomonas fakonensis]|uniref:Uncharacterized protein n=1 Tax=Pseudomonas fakonensis TaxID=2842355 RepID=A0ABX8N4Q1_9PSED|nr:hypothetical protein [Pseudomonas fakonensis]QXH51331.1 hypothetical protein KSS94_25925 [Pseudomonas fakonensis]